MYNNSIFNKYKYTYAAQLSPITELVGETFSRARWLSAQYVVQLAKKTTTRNIYLSKAASLVIFTLAKYYLYEGYAYYKTFLIKSGNYLGYSKKGIPIPESNDYYSIICKKDVNMIN